MAEPVYPTYIPGTQGEKEALKKKYTETETLQHYTEYLGDKYSEINIVKVLTNLHEFVDSGLTDMERLVFQRYYFHNNSIHEIKWTEPIDTYREVEKLLKSSKKKFEAWCLSECCD